MNNKMLKRMALGLALVVTVTSVSVPAARASEAPAFNKAKVSVKVGQTKKLKVKNAEWKLKKAVSSDENVATAKVKVKKQLVKVTGVSTGKAVVTATFKKAKQKQTVEVPVTVKDNIVTRAAKDYFNNAPANVNKYSVAEVLAKMDAGEEMLIIDIRRADDYAAGHLKGAVNVPYATIGESLELIPDNVQIFLNCYSGQTASQTTALLNVAGKVVGNIQGGWNTISTTEGIDAYLETTENKLSGKTYAVNDDIEAAIKAYYEAANTANSFNFPAADLAKLIEEGKAGAYTIVDIRSAEDYGKFHLEGANINVPFPSAMPEGFDKIPKDKPVIVQCYSGQTASQTVAILRLLGYEAYNLSGGMNGWVSAGLPVVEK